MSNDGDQLFTVMPVDFFQFGFDIHRIDPKPIDSLGKRLFQEKYRLPDLTSLCGEQSFAEVYMGWSPEGVAIHLLSQEPFKRVNYPDVTRGNSLEVFIDTRDVKTSGFNTRYCHHYYCLPNHDDGHQAGELTHFRTEDAHEWCNSEDLQFKASLHSSSYSLTLFIPAHCLVGYDPENFDRMGFAYRVNRAVGAPQHFCAVSGEFAIEQQPSLWSTLRLVK